MTTTDEDPTAPIWCPADPDLWADIVRVEVGMPPANAGSSRARRRTRQPDLRMGPSIATSPEEVESAASAVAHLA